MIGTHDRGKALYVNLVLEQRQLHREHLLVADRVVSLSGVELLAVVGARLKSVPLVLKQHSAHRVVRSVDVDDEV